MYSLYITNEYVTEGTQLYYQVCENKFMNVICNDWLYMAVNNLYVVDDRHLYYTCISKTEVWKNIFFNCYINYCKSCILGLLYLRRRVKSKIALMFYKVPSWPWSYGSWIYNYICNQLLLPLMLWARIWIRARCTTLCDKVCQWLATGR